LESYLLVNLIGPGPRLLKKEFTGPRSQRLRNTGLHYLGLCKYTFAQRSNLLATYLSERIPVIKRRISVFGLKKQVN